MADDTRSRALQHLTICDLSGQLAGAGATRYLAAFGAQVIRIEDPVRQGKWDILRGSMPHVDERRGIELGGAFNNHNVEKLGVTLNLRIDAGRELLRRLIAVSDVVTENFAAGVMAKLGLLLRGAAGHQARHHLRVQLGLRRHRPVLGLQDLGTDRPGRVRADLRRRRARRPARRLGLLLHGPHGRQHDGRRHPRRRRPPQPHGRGPVGRHVLHRGRPRPHRPRPPRLHGQRPAPAPRRACRTPTTATTPPWHPTASTPPTSDDRWVAIACRDDHDWAAFAAVCGEAWAADPRFATVAGRLADQAELDQLVVGVDVGPRPPRGRRDAAAPPACRPSAVAMPEDRIDHDPDNAAWGMLPTAHHPVMGDVRVDGLPVHLSETDWHIERGAPCSASTTGRSSAACSASATRSSPPSPTDGVV